MNKELEEFMKTKVNFAIVLNADINTVQELKKELEMNPDIELIYQKHSFRKLMIEEVE